MAYRISDKVYKFCTNPQSATSELAKDPSKAPGDIANKLYGAEHIALTERAPHHKREPLSQEDLQRARECGNWGNTQPSDLFLHCFHDALSTLEHDPLAGVVSPSLMGSNGVLPVTIMAPVPDICRHMANLIVRAEKEVFLATNFWITSSASRQITSALKELSRRAGERKQKVVVKLMYDRGNVKQVVDNHQMMSVKQYTSKAVQLPSPEEIPNIDMEVQNYHRPMLGTFHSKFMVVDRRIAIIQSNNIQDNDNLEMMTHVEGQIVDSVYDTALIAWERSLHPPLPRIDSPAANDDVQMFNDPPFLALFDEQGNVKPPGARFPKEGLEDGDKPFPLQDEGGSAYDQDIGAEILRLQTVLSPGNGETRMNAVTRHLNLATKLDRKGTAPESDSEHDEMMPIMPHKVHAPFPIAMVNRRPWGAPNHECVHVPQNEAWLSAIWNAKSSIFIQTPNLNAAPVVAALREAACRGVEVTYYVCMGYNDAGELLPFQGGNNEMVADKLYKGMTEEQKKHLHIYYYVGKDQVMPIHNKFKSRSCHIKVMVVDEHLGIQGNGNQDTQSWYHSMEVNIMIDSYDICRDWMKGFRRNQNTHLHGAASQEDGIWRDKDGNEVEGAIGKNPGRFSWVKGIVGAIQRVRGAGEF